MFLSDVLFDKETSESSKKATIPFGKNDCTVFRKMMSTEDMIQEFAPALRTGSQAEAFRIALQMLGDLCGFGISYFDIDESLGHLKTATEVSSDNSALMRNIARHEHALEVSLAGISRAALDDGLFGVVADLLNEDVLVALVLSVIPVEPKVAQHVGERFEVAAQLGLVLVSDVLEHLLLGFLDGVELLVDLHEGGGHEQARRVVGHGGRHLLDAVCRHERGKLGRAVLHDCETVGAAFLGGLERPRRSFGQNDPVEIVGCRRD